VGRDILTRADAAYTRTLCALSPFIPLLVPAGHDDLWRKIPVADAAGGISGSSVIVEPAIYDYRGQRGRLASKDRSHLGRQQRGASKAQASPSTFDDLLFGESSLSPLTSEPLLRGNAVVSGFIPVDDDIVLCKRGATSA
jgi:hypothetical protein